MATVIAKTTNAQTIDEFLAEEFIAEVFYGYMTEKSPKTYLEKRSYLPEMSGFKLKGEYVTWNKLDDENLCKKSGICDTLLHEFYDYIEQFRSVKAKVEWNENAPVFQLPKYKNLIFVESFEKLSRRKQQEINKMHFSQPAFTKNREYAVVDKTYYSYHRIKRSLKWHWNWKKPWKIMPYRQYQRDLAIYQILYRRIEGKWVKIGEFLKAIS